MSRTYAKVKISIWGDSDFRELSEAAQALYFKLLTSPTLRLCGVSDWRPKRMAALTRGQEVEGLEEAARELQDNLYVIFDEDTEEALLRTFIKHDGVLKTPNVAASMVKDFAAVASAKLRGIIVHELHRLSRDEPEHKGWPVIREVLDNPSINPSEMASPKVSGKASHNPSGNASGTDDPNQSGDPSGNDAHIPQPPTQAPNPPSGEDASGKPKRARALPDNWTPPEEVVNAMRAEMPGINIEAQHLRFTDHFRANGKPMKDWTAAWRNWMRKAPAFDPDRKPQSKQDRNLAILHRAAEREQRPGFIQGELA